MIVVAGIRCVISFLTALCARVVVSCLVCLGKVLVESLREDVHSQGLLEVTRKDADMGRITAPRKVTAEWVPDFLLHPRFGVAQERPDGTQKLRAVDHFSWSEGGVVAESVNGYIAPSEKLAHDSMDALASVMERFVELTGEVPGLIKADADSAFRRIPIRKDQRWAGGVAFKVNEEARPLVCAFRLVAVQHIACARCMWRGTRHALSEQWAPFMLGSGLVLE